MSTLEAPILRYPGKDGTPKQAKAMGRTNTNGVPPVRPPKWRPVKQLDIVGTAEAAELLDVERPRIGRWIKRGVMPPTASVLSATPVWYRRDILKMLDWVEANKRRRGDVPSDPVAS